MTTPNQKAQNASFIVQPSNTDFIPFGAGKVCTLEKAKENIPSISFSEFDVVALATLTGYYGVDGALLNGNDTNWLRSDFVQIPNATIMSIKQMGHPTIGSLCFYDESFIFISSLSPVESDGILNQDVNIPLNARWIKITIANESIYPAASNLGQFSKLHQKISQTLFDTYGYLKDIEKSLLLRDNLQINRKIDLQPTSKIILFGDSISSTDYTWYKDFMEEITGAEVYNGGFPGANASALATDYALQRIFDYVPDLIIVLLGGNDDGAVGSVGTITGSIAGEPIVSETSISVAYNGSTFVQATSYIMRRITDYYYNIRARANLTGLETEEEKTTKIDAVKKPVLVFATPLPQKRNNSSDQYSKQENWERKRKAVLECCSLHNISCVDLYKKTNFDMSLEPYWTSPTDKLTNNGVYFMDGLHPNKYGFRIISEVICGEVGI